MYTKSSVGLEEAMGAMQAMLSEIKNHPDKYWQQASIAVVDERGKLVSFAKMDGPSQIGQDAAIKKAFTAAIFRNHIHTVNAMVATRDWGIHDFHPDTTPIVGGVAIIDPKEESVAAENHTGDKSKGKPFFKKSCIGGIGVAAAGPWQLDLEVAEVGLKYIQDRVWPDSSCG